MNGVQEFGQVFAQGAVAEVGEHRGAAAAVSFVINVDATIVNVTLPSLVRHLHASTTDLQWVVDAYELVFAALVLSCGSLGDRFGREGALMSGLVLFAAASVAGSRATTATELIAARAAMGLGRRQCC